MSRKASIYVGEGLLTALSVIEDGSNRSQRINTIAERYMAIIEDSMPEFTVSERTAIVDANNGCVLSDLQTATATYANIWDYPADILSEKWGIDAKRIASKIRALSLPGRLAVAEVIERYWSGAYCINNQRKALERAGANIKEVARVA